MESKQIDHSKLMKNILKITTGVLLILMEFSAMAQSDSPVHNPYLEEAKILYGHLQFADVVPKLEKALTVPGNSNKQLCDIYSMMGVVHVVLKNNGAAKRAFTELLKLNPKFKLDPGASPKILNFFELVKNSFTPQAKVTFSGRPKVLTESGKPPQVEVEVDDPTQVVALMVLYVKTGDERVYSKRPMAALGNNRYRGTLSFDPKMVSSKILQVAYFIQAKAVDGKLLNTLGSPENPNIFTVMASGTATVGTVETPWFREWWFWTAIGVVVAGSALGIALGLEGKTEMPVGTLGTLELEN